MSDANDPVTRVVRDVGRSCPWPERVTPAQLKRVEEVCRRILDRRPPPARIADVGTGIGLLPAALAGLGYQAIGVDDFGDPWQGEDAAATVAKYAQEAGFEFIQTPMEQYESSDPLDCVTLINVVEHLHDSPRPLLNHIGELLAPGGLCVIVMPNAVNLRKRIAVLRGRTNYPPLEQFFGSSIPWRGHVREYTPAEGADLLRLAHFDVLDWGTFDSILFDRALHPAAVLVYRTLSSAAPSLKDTLYAIGSRSPSWRADMSTGPSREAYE
jgi:SAM-dependent methyltransferase